ncbi:MAG: hypothetical protein H6999_02435 [Hahellaceae bacterium]|nr:hypothetical protein [Hahellaceae bacterium]MCP5168600.1 hypothetical protein [Hahellaceae bacterium]
MRLRLLFGICALSASAASPAASISDVIIMAECGGFFNAYGSLTGQNSLYATGSRLAAQVMLHEQDKRSVALSFERGSEFAETLHVGNSERDIREYIQMCTQVVGRNIDYLASAT